MINWKKHHTEAFIEKHADKVNWYYISVFQKLSESFIEKHANKVRWGHISRHQKLSEPFIKKHVDEVDWGWISRYQKLSETFIERYDYKVDWHGISCCQKLSESFIERHADKVNWYYISVFQKLSEPFIERHANDVDWYNISLCQRLSESFIEKHADEVCWSYIRLCQKLSEKFRKKHNIKTPPDNWLYKPASFKKKAVQDTGLYECHKDYFIAYKGIRSDRYSKYNFQYRYEKGGVYESTADFTAEENSFGLSAWTEGKARGYCDELVVRVKIYYKDVARVVHEGGKIRATKIEILD